MERDGEQLLDRRRRPLAAPSLLLRFGPWSEKLESEAPCAVWIERLLAPLDVTDKAAERA